jgi:hypothetical protein
VHACNAASSGRFRSLGRTLPMTARALAEVLCSARGGDLDRSPSCDESHLHIPRQDLEMGRFGDQQAMRVAGRFVFADA